MDIRIKTLTLHNFKGLRDASFDFGGGNARIEGDNGRGKSTVFDAFVWLLFGKDHAGQDWTNFDLKPIDPATREPIHNLDHWVEAVLAVDGVDTRLRRVVLEDWVKPRGQAEKVLQGHKQLFFIDGVDTGTKNAYDAAIHQWIDERLFKLLTNPLFFIDDRYTKWQDRRKAIVTLVGEADRVALAGRFADLLAEMKGEQMETFRKRIAAAKRENRKRLEESTASAAAFKKALPEVPAEDADAAALEASVISERDEKIAGIRQKISDIDAKIASATDAAADRRKAVDEKNREILNYRIKMGDFIAAGLKAAQEQNKAREQAVSEASAEADRLEREIEDLRRGADKDRQAVEDYGVAHYDDAARLRELGDRYEKERSRVFQFDGQDVCPSCGRPYPEEQIAEERESKAAQFVAERKAAMEKIAAEAQKLKDSIAKTDGWIEERKAAAASKDEKADACQVALTQAREALLDAGSAPAVDLAEEERKIRSSAEFLKMAETERKMVAVLNGMAAGADDGSLRELMAERRKLEADIQIAGNEADEKLEPVRARKAIAGERDRILGLISEAETAAAGFADEVARLERLEDRAAEYVKAEIDSMDEAISSLFRVARWKMFSTTIDGGLQDMCEVTSPDGVPYRSMNDAQKILCGMDVIRVFSEAYDCSAPIFIDTAESITRTDFGTASQVIRLVVTPGADTLNTVAEGPAR